MLRKLLAIIIFGFFILGIAQPGLAADTNEVFTQTDWLGGETSNPAIHPTNKLNWNQFESQSETDPARKLLTSSGNLYMKEQPYIITSTPGSTVTDTTEADFKKLYLAPDKRPVFNSVTVNTQNGTGDPAYLELQSQVTDPFASSLRQWRTMPSMPTFGRYSVFTRMGNFIYCVLGSGDGRQFGRYNIGNKSWEFLAPLPVPVGAGCAIANDGEYIYVLRGSGSADTYFYLPYDSSVPAGAGNFTPLVAPQPGEWRPFDKAPGTIGKGSAMIFIGSHPLSTKDGSSSRGRLFVLRGNATENIYIYDIFVSDYHFRWSGSVSFGSTRIEYGSCLAYQPGSDYIYIAEGSESGRIWRYQISNAQLLAPSTLGKNLPPDPNDPTHQPIFTYRPSNLCYPGTGQYLYAANLYNTYVPGRYQYRTDRGFWRFGPLNGDPVWQRLDDIPANIDGYNFIIYDPDLSGTKLHFLSGKNYTNPWEYDPQEQKWNTLSLAPLQSENYGKTFFYPNTGDYAYYLSGNTNLVFRYSLSRNNWVQIKELPEVSYYPGNRLAYVNGYLFCLVGNNSRNWYRYDVSQTPGSPTEQWVQMSATESAKFPSYDSDPNTPGVQETVNWGSGIVGITIAGKDYLYALRGSNTNHFYRFNVTPTGADTVEGTSWSTLQNQAPFGSQGAGGSYMIIPDYSDAQGHKYLYASKARGGSEIWKYGPIEEDAGGNKTWTQVSTTGSGLWINDYGGAFVYPGSGQYLYIFNGGAYNAYDSGSRWWRLDLASPTPSWLEMDQAPFATGGSACGANGTIYAVCVWNASGFWKYDIAQDKWNDAVIDQVYPYVGNLVVDGDNNIYVIHSYSYCSFSNIWVFTPTSADINKNNRWTQLIRSPVPLTYGSLGAYLEDSEGNKYLYLTKGRGSNKIYRYNLTAKTWDANPQLLPFVMYKAGQMVAGKNSIGQDCLYLFSGYGHNKFGVFYPSSGVGFMSTATPSGFSSNDWLAKTLAYVNDGTNRRLYFIQPNSSKMWYLNLFDDFSNWSWISATAVGDETAEGISTLAVTSGGGLFYPGSGDLIYCIPGSVKDFVSYSISNNRWSRSPASLPTEPVDGTTDIVNAGKPWYFVYNYKWGDHFMRYYPAPVNSWDEMGYLPVSITNGGVTCGYGGYIYYWPGKTKSNFYRYNTENNTWQDLASFPSPYTSDYDITALPVTAGQLSIYFTGGRYSSSLYRYDIAAGTWNTYNIPSLLGVSFGLGNSLAYIPGDNYLYITAGDSSNGTDILRLDITNPSSDASWVKMTKPTSIPMNRGASMIAIRRADGDYLYALCGGRKQNFYYWKIGDTVNDWRTKASCPVSINDSSSKLLYPGFGDYIYYLQGSSYWDWDESYVFLRYSISLDTWEELTPASFAIDWPTTLAYAGGEYFYVTKGRDNANFTKYYAFSFGNYISDIKEVGNHAGWGNIDWAWGLQQAANVAVRTGNKPDLSDALAWDKVAYMSKNSPMASSAIHPNDRFIQYRIDFGTDDPVVRPILDSITLNYTKYPNEQYLISSPFRTTFEKNRLRKISWHEILGQKGTDLRLQIRTAAGNGTDVPPSSASWSPWLGPASVDSSAYTVNSDNAALFEKDAHVNLAVNGASLYRVLEEFKYSQEIKVVNNSASTLTNQIVKVEIPSTDIDFWNNINQDGSDIRFHNGAQKLSYYLASFSYSTKKAIINVKIPSLPPSSTQSIFIIYGCANAISESDLSLTVIPSTADLLACWRFEDSNPTYTTDSSGHNLYAYFRNGASLDPSVGRYSKGLKLNLDGSTDNQYCEVYNNPSYNFGGDVTIAYWLKPTKVGYGYRVAMEKGYYYKEFCFLMYSGGRDNTYVWSGQDSADDRRWGTPIFYPTGIANNVWTHYVFTRKGNVDGTQTITTYKNGQYETSATCPVGRTSSQSSYSLKIGNGYTSVGVGGYMDDVVAYNRAFTSTDVQALYSGYSLSTEIGPVTTYLRVQETTAAIASLPGWNYKVPIVLDNRNYPAQNNRIVTLNIDKWYELWNNNHVRSDGADIRFVDSNDNALPFNLASFDSTLKTATTYTKVSVPANQMITIYMVYGNPSATSASETVGGSAYPSSRVIYPFNPQANNTFNLGIFYADNPSILPVQGVFYSNNELLSFEQNANVSAGTAIGYQVSPDGYKWYYWNGTAWVEVAAGYNNSNTFQTVSAHLQSFQTAFPTGDFYWRAFLHSDTGQYSPILNGITVNFSTGVSYYVDATGQRSINVEHANSLADEWMQYKVNFYSEGAFTAILNDLSLEYANPFIHILTPAPEDSLTVGQTCDITWESNGLGETETNVKIEYQTSVGPGGWKTIIESTPNDGSFTWQVPNDATTGARLRISSVEVPIIEDISGGTFKIMGLVITSPNGGESWEVDSYHNITWTSFGSVSNYLMIQYSIDGGITWLLAGAEQSNSGSFPWHIPSGAQPSDHVKVRIYDTKKPDPDHPGQWISIDTNQNGVIEDSEFVVIDVSDAEFSILPKPVVTIDSPNGTPDPENWKIGTNHDIQWHTNSQQFAEHLKLEYSTNGFSDESKTHEIAVVDSGAPVAPQRRTTASLPGNYSWIIPNDISDNVKVRISEVLPVPADRDTQQAKSDISDNQFIIANPEIIMTRPNTSGLTWVVGDSEMISWDNDGDVGSNVKIEYSRDGFAGHRATIKDTIATATKQFQWLIPEDVVLAGQEEADITIRITSLTHEEYYKDSQYTVKVIPHETLTLIQPVGGEQLVMGQPYEIKWSSLGTKDAVVNAKLNIYYSLDSGVTWTQCTGAVNQANDGSFMWLDPPVAPAGEEFNHCRVKIESPTNPNLHDASQNDFSINNPRITVRTPNGGETWYATGKYDITWTTIGAIGENALKLEYSVNNGAGWNLIAQNVSNMNTFIDEQGNLIRKYEWASIADVNSNQVLVRITDTTRPSVTDISNAVFTIKPPAISLTSPLGLPGSVEEWVVGTNHDITWNSEGTNGSISDKLTMQYSTTGSGGPWITLATNEPNDGTYSWQNLPFPASATCRVKIFDSMRTATTDMSDGDFKIVLPYIEVTEPHIGAAWPIGTNPYIEWQVVGTVSSTWKIEYSHGDFSDPQIPVYTIGDELSIGSYQYDPVTGKKYFHYQWPGVPNDFSAINRIRIRDFAHPEINDISNVFSISSPIITLTQPNGNELWTLGDTVDVKWNYTGSVNNNVKLEYSTNNFDPQDPSKTHLIADNVTVPKVGGVYTYPWLIPENENESATVSVRITENLAAGSTWQAASDKSDSTFTFLPIPFIDITSPNGAEVFHRGEQVRIQWTKNSGAFSNNLVLYYSPDAGANWTSIVGNIPGSATEYLWTVPNNAQISQNYLIKIVDEGSPRAIKPNGQSNAVFTITYPLITLTSPVGGEYWACRDHAPITWSTIGSISTDIMLQFSTDGVNYGSIPNIVIPNTGSYTWIIPDNFTLGIIYLRLIDTADAEHIKSVAKTVNIIQNPEITIVMPNGTPPGEGERDTYVLGDSLPITWSSKGLSLDNISISYAKYSENGTEIASMPIASNLGNTGSYQWVIPIASDTLTDSRIKVKITADTRNGTAVDSSDYYFRIRGGFEITSPNGGELLVCKAPQTITWLTKGAIQKVKLEYTTDPDPASGAPDNRVWTTIVSAADNVPNSSGISTYYWNNVPDILTDTLKIKISDAYDSSVQDESNGYAKWVYMPVKFCVLDFDSSENLRDLTVSEGTTWSESGLESPITMRDGGVNPLLYKYGTYTTFFSKSQYNDNSVTWSPPHQLSEPSSIYVVTCLMISTSSAQSSWEAILSYSYSPGSDVLSAVGSLQGRGRLIGVTPEQRALLGGAVLTIYEPDGQAIRTTLSASAPNENGMYNFTYAPTNFEAGKVYPATLRVIYMNSPYTSTNNIDVSSELLQYEFFTQTAEQLNNSVNEIKESVQTGTAQTKENIDQSREELKRDLQATATDVKNQVTATGASLQSVLTSTESRLTTKVEEARKETEIARKSEILNRENTVRVGQPLTIRYRTYPGTSPTIQVYNPVNKQVFAGNMKLVASTAGANESIYEYTVTFDAGWDKGDFTVVCSEPTYGSLDALIISVIRADLESIAGNVSAVLGNTSSISTLKEVADSLNSQFSIIETALSQVGKSLIKDAKDAANSGKALDSIFTQLSTIAAQMKQMVGKTSYNIDKLFSVSAEKKQDIVYLKNKTQQLKATMDLNKKMIDNIANKPITQTWYEYRQ